MANMKVDSSFGVKQSFMDETSVDYSVTLEITPEAAKECARRYVTMALQAAIRRGEKPSSMNIGDGVVYITYND